MTESSSRTEVYLEIGQKRVVAGALHWPGWCRIGRGEESALQSLFDYGLRYAQALRNTTLGFSAPKDISALAVVEQVEGTSTTDFGAPDAALSGDARPVDSTELNYCVEILQACWGAFDEAAAAAVGKELRKGPRGGGRDLEGVIEHVIGADAYYLSRLAWKFESSKGVEKADLSLELDRTRQATLSALTAATRGETPQRGPRGGIIWTPRYFVRRVAWHVLDHAWEIEERIM